MQAFNRFSPLLTLTTLLIAAPLASAQPMSAGAGTDALANEDEDTVIVVEGYRRDRALDAFLRGDFATAEVEFGNNWRCIWRNQRLFEAAVRDQMSSAMAPSTPTGSNHMSEQRFLRLNMPQRADEIRERTCFNPEWQFYMMGLSQIQLGKFAEAKESLYRAAWRTKEDLMFDAHYRIGLLELMDGNIERADRRLSYLTRLQRSCHKRGVRCEVQGDLEVATAFLRRAIANARQEGRG